MAAVDWSDPCARFAALRDSYYVLLAGGTESMIRFKGPEGEREVRFAKSNIELLRTELRDAEAACNLKNGVTTGQRRYAIRGGAQVPGYGGWWDIDPRRFRP